MSQNHHLPTTECAAFTSLLPLASHALLSEAEDTQLRFHLAACAHCRAELAIYEHVEEALRRTFAPHRGALSPFSREALMQTLDHHDDLQAPVAPLPAPAVPERRPSRLLSGLAALAATLVIVVLSASIFSIYAHRGKTAGPAAQSVATPPPARGSQALLHDISMVSPTEGWAVGEANPSNDGNHPIVLLMRYTNGAWSRVNIPIQGQLTSISMLSATDGWAVGDDGTILHYDGRTWKEIAHPIGAYLHRVQILSSTDVWGVGDGGYSGANAIWHYDGQGWSVQPLSGSLNLGPQGNSLMLYGLSMVSPGEGWAVGALTPNGKPGDPPYPTIPPAAVILHYVGGQWTVDKTIQGATLRSVSMSSVAEGWAAGETDAYVPNNDGGVAGTTGNSAPLLLHYAHGQWVQVASPLNTPSSSYAGAFIQVAMRSVADGWLIGGVDLDTGTPALFHYDGAIWSEASLPTINDTEEWPISSIAMTSAAEGWAVGSWFSKADKGIPDRYGFTPTITPLILHYLNGAWSVYSQA